MSAPEKVGEAYIDLAVRGDLEAEIDRALAEVAAQRRSLPVPINAVVNSPPVPTPSGPTPGSQGGPSSSLYQSYMQVWVQGPRPLLVEMKGGGGSSGGMLKSSPPDALIASSQLNQSYVQVWIQGPRPLLVEMAGGAGVGGGTKLPPKDQDADMLRLAKVVASGIVMGGGLNAVAAASPNRYATFELSIQKLEMAFGQTLLPAIDKLATGFQGAASAVNKGATAFQRGVPGEAQGPLALAAVGGASGFALGGLKGALIGGLTGGLIGIGAEIYSKFNPETKFSTRGLPQPQSRTWEQYAHDVDQAGLVSDTLEGSIETQQLNNAVSMNAKLDKLDDILNAVRAIQPVWSA